MSEKLDDKPLLEAPSFASLIEKKDGQSGVSHPPGSHRQHPGHHPKIAAGTTMSTFSAVDISEGVAGNAVVMAGVTHGVKATSLLPALLQEHAQQQQSVGLQQTGAGPRASDAHCTGANGLPAPGLRPSSPDSGLKQRCPSLPTLSEHSDVSSTPYDEGRAPPRRNSEPVPRRVLSAPPPKAQTPAEDAPPAPSADYEWEPSEEDSAAMMASCVWPSAVSPVPTERQHAPHSPPFVLSRAVRPAALRPSHPNLLATLPVIHMNVPSPMRVASLESLESACNSSGGLSPPLWRLHTARAATSPPSLRSSPEGNYWAGSDMAGSDMAGSDMAVEAGPPPRPPAPSAGEHGAYGGMHVH